VTLATVDRRSRALTYLVGDARAYLQQLDLAHAELAELHDYHLTPLLEALVQAHALVGEVNSRGTATLRGSCTGAA
jgi:hypothetical protein